MIVRTPGTDTVVWQGFASTEGEVAGAVSAARSASEAWRVTSIEERLQIAERFGAIATERASQLAASISGETGKPKWEAASEAKLVPAKVQLAINAYRERCGSTEHALPQGTGRVVYQSLGVVAVLGPFNFPAHLPNGHIVPALLAGNSVVFKPSERTPGTGELLAQYWSDAGLPQDTLRVVHGDAVVGGHMIGSDVDAVLFTGSFRAGSAIHRSLGGRPGVLLALEMGGNNPLVIDHVEDLDAAVYLSVLSAFVTAGQRCTCARRLILVDSDHVDSFLEKLIRKTSSLRVGMPDDDPPPFMGPTISSEAAERVLEAQGNLIRKGGISLVSATRVESNPALVRPGIVDVTRVEPHDDEEIFGPFLQVIRVPDFESAIREANRTQYGLSASLLSDSVDRFKQFRGAVRAGVINWNQPTIGASGRLPFGGRGDSGNHRPSGYFAADYCADAIAILESAQLSMPSNVMPGISGD